MSSDKVVINASPFILLSKTGLLESLQKVFGLVTMPQGVASEIKLGDDAASEYLSTAAGKWLTVVSVNVDTEVEVWNLGTGETEVLSFALSRRVDLALIDDRAARRCATTLGIKCLGTAGLLVLFKQRGLIESVAVEISRLESAGLYLADSIRAAILSEAGESENPLGIH